MKNWGRIATRFFILHSSFFIFNSEGYGYGALSHRSRDRPDCGLPERLDRGLLAHALYSRRPVRRGEVAAATGRQGQYPAQVRAGPATVRAVRALYVERAAGRLRHLVSKPD